MRFRKKGVHSRAGQTKTDHCGGVSGHTENVSVVIMIMLAREGAEGSRHVHAP